MQTWGWWKHDGVVIRLRFWELHKFSTGGKDWFQVSKLQTFILCTTSPVIDYHKQSYLDSTNYLAGIKVRSSTANVPGLKLSDSRACPGTCWRVAGLPPLYPSLEEFLELLSSPLLPSNTTVIWLSSLLPGPYSALVLCPVTFCHSQRCCWNNSVYSFHIKMLNLFYLM